MLQILLKSHLACLGKAESLSKRTPGFAFYFRFVQACTGKLGYSEV